MGQEISTFRSPGAEIMLDVSTDSGVMSKECEVIATLF